MRAPVGKGKERLLQKLFDEFGDNGPRPNLSMRQVAERLGVHHTLLTYHFGSRPGLLRAVLSEARHHDYVVIAAADDALEFVPLCRTIWNFYSNNEFDDRTRAFFHLVGLALYERDAFDEFVADIEDLTRLLETAALHDGASETDAKLRSILATSCLRGLLLQRLLTPSADVDAAAERFLSSMTAFEGDVPASGTTEPS